MGFHYILNPPRMLHIISLRAQITQNEKYWYENVTYCYQFFTRCEELVPIFHSVKFVKCEICGSTAVAGSSLIGVTALCT